MSGAEERLQKYLARHGYGSRRQAEDWIRAGRVAVNGKPAELGQKVRGNEDIALDGRKLKFSEVPLQTLIYRKRVDEIVTRKDPEGRPSIFARLPKLPAGRWISVGRLDINTAGLLLVTTDGELARALMHPSTGLSREYVVRVHGHAADAAATLSRGVELEDGPARFDNIQAGERSGANQWFKVTLSEGRNRIVRRLWESVDAEVSRLIRIRFGPIRLPDDLLSGSSRPLTAGEQRSLYQAAGLPVPAALKSGGVKPRGKRGRR